MIDIYTLMGNEMTSDILDKHDIKVYFSGRKKEIGDKFLLAVLLIPDYSTDVEIVIDLCDKDIRDNYYEMVSLKTHGKLKLAYLKLNKINDVILENIMISLNLTKTEKKLEKLKDEINREIDLRKNKKGLI